MDMLGSWVHIAIPTLFVIICVLLILVILLQKGRGGGLSGAFGGGGGYSAFGAKTGDVFTWVTVALTFLFVLVACLGVWLYVPESDEAGAMISGPDSTTNAPLEEGTPSGTPVTPAEG